MVDSAWNKDVNLFDNNLSMASILYRWNMDVFGNIHKKKKRLIARIHGVQNAMALNFNNRLIKLDIKLRKELDEVLARRTFLFSKVT